MGDRTAWDVLVVGAGPAGTATAIAAARRGARVLLLEAVASPRHRSAETLHPEVEPILDQLSVLIEEVAPDRYSGHRFQIPGARLDAALLGCAGAFGVTVRHETARDAVMMRGAVTGVETRASTYRAAITVDASGRRHWLARQLGLPIRRHAPRLVARYGSTGDGPAIDDVPSPAADTARWKSTAGSSRGLSGLRAFRPRGRVHAADVTWRVVEPAVGNCYVLVGDAAVTLDPASSQGLLRALLGALKAGAAAATVAMEATPVETAFRGYREWLTESFVRDASALAARWRRVAWI